MSQQNERCQDAVMIERLVASALQREGMKTDDQAY
jgi:hypothetical protein